MDEREAAIYDAMGLSPSERRRLERSPAYRTEYEKTFAYQAAALRFAWRELCAKLFAAFGLTRKS